MRPVKPLLLGMTYKDEVEIVLPVLLYSLFLPLMVEREFVAAVSLTWPSDSVVSSSLAVKATLASEELLRGLPAHRTSSGVPAPTHGCPRRASCDRAPGVWTKVSKRVVAVSGSHITRVRASAQNCPRESVK